MSNTRYRNIYIDGCSHFCTAAVVQHLPVFADNDLRQTVLSSWDSQRSRWSVGIEGFVIMPEHFHVLVNGTADGVRKFMQYSLAETSREVSAFVRLRANAGDGRCREWLEVLMDKANGSAQHKVWKERFRCIALNQPGAVATKLQYMHLNPVKRGLVVSPEDWAWSSYSHYHGGECTLRIDCIGT